MTAEILEHHESPQPYFFRFRSSHSMVLAAVSVAIFNDVFLFGTLIPVLPYALPGRINVGDEDVQMCIAILLAAYGGALLVGALLFGWIGDKLGQRHALFLLGLSILLAATTALALGQNMVVLTLGRMFQGFAAAVVWTSGLGLITDIFGKDRYGEAIGYAQTSVSIGTTSAPLFGGVVYSHGGYSAVSALSIATIIVSIILALIMVEPKSEDRWKEHPGRHNSTEATEEGNPTTPELQNPTALDAPSEFSDDSDEQSPLLKSKSKTNRFQNRSAYPMLFRSGRVLAAMFGLFAYAFVIISFEGMVPLFVKGTFHWDSIHAALIFLSWIIPGFLGPIAGKTSDRIGPRWTAVAGFLFAAPALIFMRFVTNNTIGHKVLLCALLTLVGFGLVWVVPSCISDLQAAAVDLKRENPREFGDLGASSQAFGLFVFSWSLGSLVGPPVSAIINAKADWGSATVALAMACVVACIPIMLKTPASPHRKSSALC